MTARIINSLSSRSLYRLHFMYHAQEFSDYLDQSVKKYTLPFHSKSHTPFMPGALTWQTSYIRDLIKSIGPDLMIISQGYAESGIRGLWAAHNLQIKKYSYIPFGNNNSELNNRFAYLRDKVCKLIYRLPEGYITISNYQSKLLKRFTRSDQPIYVINNPANFEYASPSKNAAYKPGRKLEMAVVGRINFKQKNQDRLVPMARILSERIAFRIHIIGDGPDKDALKNMIVSSGLEDQFILHGWMNREKLISFMSNNIDLVLIPSLYEGLPLILLESLHLNKPFIMSKLALLDEYNIPNEWLFDPTSPSDIAEHVVGLSTCFNPEVYTALRERVLSLHSLERFNSDVVNVFNTLLE